MTDPLAYGEGFGGSDPPNHHHTERKPIMSHLQERDPVQVTLERGMLRLRRGNPQAEGLYDQDTTNALREYFQAERDEELGRWRDPENPNIVVYPGSVSLDWVIVLDESTGRTDVVFKQPRKPPKDSAFTLVAERYFAAHQQPEPKPWEDAKPGEYWAVTVNGERKLVHGGPQGLYSGEDWRVIPNSDITAGHRIWPEGEASE